MLVVNWFVIGRFCGRVRVRSRRNDVCVSSRPIERYAFEFIMCKLISIGEGGEAVSGVRAEVSLNNARERAGVTSKLYDGARRDVQIADTVDAADTRESTREPRVCRCGYYTRVRPETTAL